MCDESRGPQRLHGSSACRSLFWRFRTHAHVENVGEKKKSLKTSFLIGGGDRDPGR